MRERKSNFAVVSAIGDWEKEFITEYVNGLLYEDHLTSLDNEAREELKKNEIPKTKDDLRFIEMANERTNQLLGSVQLEPYNIPVQNFYKIRREIYKKYNPENTAGAFDADHQMILLNVDFFPKNRLCEALVIFHESSHLKSYLAEQAIIENESNDQVTFSTKKYREGVGIFSPQKNKLNKKDNVYLMGLNEAIVAHEEKEYLADLLRNPMFAEEAQKMASPEAKKIKRVLERKQGIPGDEIIDFDSLKNYYLGVAYREQRNVLDYLCRQIAQDVQCSPERIYYEFLKSQLTGRITLLANLVENSFGKGSFRELGKMTPEKETAVITMELMRSLIQRRRAS